MFWIYNFDLKNPKYALFLYFYSFINKHINFKFYLCLKNIKYCQTVNLAASSLVKK